MVINCTGALFSFEGLDADGAAELLVDLLGVSYADALTETKHCRGPNVRLSWLRDEYRRLCDDMRWSEAARAYLLHLVGCTIFADKSSTSVGVVFLEAFCDLSTCGGYAWGASALAYMYDHLKDASFHRTRQLAGYITIVQVNSVLSIF